jgi:hypothetical protein
MEVTNSENTKTTELTVQPMALSNATTTPNLQLEKPAETDFYDIGVFNSNADKIDAAYADLTAQSMQKSDIVFGTYTGNAPEDYEMNTAYSQTINLGFTPKAVVAYRYGYYMGGLALEGHPTDPNDNNGRHEVEVVTNGFKVLTYLSTTGDGWRANNGGSTYYFIAFKNGQIVEK